MMPPSTRCRIGGGPPLAYLLVTAIFLGAMQRAGAAAPTPKPTAAPKETPAPTKRTVAVPLPSPAPITMTDATTCAPGEYAVSVTITAATIKSDEVCVAQQGVATPMMVVSAGGILKTTSEKRGLYPVWMEDVDLGCVNPALPLEFTLVNTANGNAACLYEAMSRWSRGRRAVVDSDSRTSTRTARMQEFSFQLESASGRSTVAIEVVAKPAPVLTVSTWHNTTPGDEVAIVLGVLAFLLVVGGFFYTVHKASLQAMAAGSRAAGGGEDTTAMLQKKRGAGGMKGVDAEKKQDHAAAFRGSV